MHFPFGFRVWISRGLESAGTRPVWTCPPRAIHPPWALGPFLVPLRTDRNGMDHGAAVYLPNWGKRGTKVLPVLDRFIMVYWFIQVISSWFIESLLKVYWFMFLGFANKLFGFRIARFPGTGSRNAGLCSAGLVRLRQLWAGDTVEPACLKIIRNMGRTCWVWCKLMQFLSCSPNLSKTVSMIIDH